MRKQTAGTIMKAAGLAVSVLTASIAFARDHDTLAHFVFRTTVTPQGLSDTTAVPVYGRGTFVPLYRGLPPGSANAAVGAKVFAARCSACHGNKQHLESGFSMESCWQHTNMLFNFVKRAMPFNAPGSLKGNEIYAVVAFLLSEAKIIKPKEVMNAKTLPKVVMPNRDGLVPNVCPELSLYR